MGMKGMERIGQYYALALTETFATTSLQYLMKPAQNNCAFRRV